MVYYDWLNIFGFILSILVGWLLFGSLLSLIGRTLFD